MYIFCVCVFLQYAFNHSKTGTVEIPYGWQECIGTLIQTGTLKGIDKNGFMKTVPSVYYTLLINSLLYVYFSTKSSILTYKKHNDYWASRTVLLHLSRPGKEREKRPPK